MPLGYMLTFSYIKLAACPITHVSYLKGLPSYIVKLLNKPLKELFWDELIVLNSLWPNWVLEFWQKNRVLE
jgi:hypothetical protein